MVSKTQFRKVGDEIPDDIRDREVRSDPTLSEVEQELRVVGAKDQSSLTVSTEIPTIIRWLQSIEEATFEEVRVDQQGTLVGCNARVPKGIVKLQGTARKSNNHGQMVTYGSLRGDD